ncbi:MAG: carbohydrate kinase [Bacteroidetes bacterium]|nr:MAG: carbohydrate kinase [Bacteroidota bacterium]
MQKILCLGEALIDMICTDKGTSLTHGVNFLKKPGGAPTNVAAAIAALGGQVSVAAMVGTDPFGDHLQNVLEKFGVDTTYLLTSPAHFTTFAFVSLLENGERDFYFNRGADAAFGLPQIEQIACQQFGIFHFGSATAFLGGPLQQAYNALLHKAQLQQAFICFDPNYRQLLFGKNQESFIEQSWQYLHACNFFKVSDEEALLLTQTQTLQEAVEIFQAKTTAVFAITLGKDGTLLRVGNHVQTIPSIPITPVDTTGAGDAFVGAVLYQLSVLDANTIHSLDAATWTSLVQKANKAGARTCEFMGAMEAFRYLNKEILA